MDAPTKYRSPFLFPTWYRHGKADVEWPRGYPHPEDEPRVTCPSCHGDLIDYDPVFAVEAGLPACRDARRSW